MPITFDGVAKLIILPLGTTTISVQDLYSAWVDWFGTGDNSKFLPAFRFVGGDPVSDTKNLGITFFIINGYRIRPQESDHRLTVEGNLYTDPAGFSPFVGTLGNYNVVIEMQVSNLSDVITVNTSGGDPTAIANSVWSHSFVAKLLTIPKYLTLK